MKKIYLVLLVVLSVNLVSAQTTMNGFFGEADKFFKSYVSSGLVDYGAIKRTPAKLHGLVKYIGIASLSNSSKQEKKAFYINAYNILVINQIIKNYPLKSPMDVGGFFDKNKHKIAGESLALNDIENKKLRAVYKDSRLHFVLVCAALSCPTIANYAYKPATLEQQLNARTRLALNSRSFIQLKSADKKVLISEIFKWYKADFTNATGTLTAYLNKYRKMKVPADYKVGYYTYNWTLNKKKIVKTSKVAKKPAVTKKIAVVTPTITKSNTQEAVETKEVVNDEVKKVVPIVNYTDTVQTEVIGVKVAKVEKDTIPSKKEIVNVDTEEPVHEVLTATQIVSNIQAYTPSKLLKKGQWDFKIFNNLYTQTKGANENGDVTKNLPRATYFTTTLETYNGISNDARINVGLIVSIKSNFINKETSDFAATKVFSFKNEDGYSRAGITSIAPSIKFSPFKSFSNFSVQSSFHISLIDHETENSIFLDKKSNIWETRFFYDKTFGGNKFQLFTELDVAFYMGKKGEGYANNSLGVPMSVFLSYFPSNNFTIYVNGQHFRLLDLGNNFTQNYTLLGAGAKYQLTASLNLEVSYGNFVTGNATGLGQTFNLGLRFIR